MNLLNSSSAEWGDWRWQYGNRLRRPEDLAELGGGNDNLLEEWDRVSQVYPFAITPYYASLMDPTDRSDPIRRQCLPDIRELADIHTGQDDPLEEDRHMPVPGLIRRYPDRCLALATNRCAVYCRHCNRKRFWKQGNRRFSRSYFQGMSDWVAQNPSLREVIVSGGDPLLLPEAALDRFLGSLKAIPHVEVLRIGSRIPAVMPMRIDKQLVGIMKKYRPLWFNTQFNHPREITPEAARACDLLLTAGIPVSNQAVLLKGVNDEPETLRELFYGLQRLSIRPYYLFSCDRVKGVDHFQVAIPKGMEMMEQLWQRTSGLCLPRFVLDAPGERGKIPLQPLSRQDWPDMKRR
ncbi:MAG: lysine 2,3-aminomutase [Thermodesulfobacteriota bacterium]|nr:lysine 2,3-aminomutase [Thermodesulfobacteriota bacterium]